jgi:hypothetical protein
MAKLTQPMFVDYEMPRGGKAEGIDLELDGQQVFVALWEGASLCGKALC